MNRLRKRATYANVMSTLAVFLALGGGAYAALQLPAKSVGTKQLKKSSVGTAQLKRRAVTPGKVNPSTIALFEGQTGPTGATGAIGPTFGDAKQLDEFDLPNCDQATIFDYPVTIARPSRIFVWAQAEYHKSGDRPENPTLQVQMLDGSSAQVARSRQTSSGSLSEQSNYIGDIFAGGVLMVPSDPNDSAAVDTTAFVAPPGDYTLRLIGGNFGNCIAPAPSMENIALNYLLLGISP